MADESMVEPRAGVSPPAETAPTPETNAAPGLSDELLQIPAMQAVFAGQPAAFSAVLKDFEMQPEAKIIAAHKNELITAGFGLYRSLDGAQGVVFNSLHLHPEQIKAADQAGQLTSIAPPFNELNQAIASSGADNPVLNAQVPPGAAPPPTAGMPSALMAGPPPPASVQRTLASKRVANLQPSAPTSGSAPGGGNLLRNILRPVL